MMQNKIVRYSIQCFLTLISFYTIQHLLELNNGTLNVLIDLSIVLFFHLYYFYKEEGKLKDLWSISIFVSLFYLVFKYSEVYFIQPELISGMHGKFRVEYLASGMTIAQVETAMKTIASIINQVTWPIITAVGLFTIQCLSVLIVFGISNLLKKKTVA